MLSDSCCWALVQALRSKRKICSSGINGTEIANPRYFRKTQKRPRRAQRRVARRKKLSKRWKKAVRIVAKIHRKVFNQRNDFQHKLSRQIINEFGTIVVEDLNVSGLPTSII